MLELHVLSYSGTEPIVPIAVTFVDGHGTIGRSPENTLVLPDPDRHVSRTQAKVTALGQGRYEIENVSTANPIFIGSAEVESGRRAALRVGDELRVGLYVVGAREVVIAPGQVASGDAAAHLITTPVKIARDLARDPPRDPPRDPLSQPLAANIPSDFDPFALPSAASRNSSNPLEEYGKSNVVSLRGILEQTTHVDRLIDAGPPKSGQIQTNPLFDNSPSGIGEAQSLDPLKLFGSSGSSIFSSTFSSGIDAPASNHASELASFLNLPKPQVQEFARVNEIGHRASPLPAAARDSQPFGVGINQKAASGVESYPTGPTKTREPTSTLAVTVPAGVAIAGPAFNDRMIAAEPLGSEPKASPPTAAAKIEQTAMSSDSRPAKLEKKSTIENTSMGTLQSDQPSPTADNEALLRALFDGAGVPDLDFPQELDEALMRKIGMLLQVSVTGAVDMIQARAATKKELRADVTMIVSSGNNPLKFAPDGQAAMAQLLGRPFRGFMPPVEAVKDAFDDLRAHQFGVMVGTRAALGDVFQRFNPAKLESQLTSPSLAQALVPSVRKAKLWDLYTNMFAQIASEAEDDFQALFGKAFRTAYENEVNNLKNSQHG